MPARKLTSSGTIHLMSRIKQAVLPLIQLYPRVFRLMWQANGWRLVLAIALALFGALSGPLQIWISAVAIDRIVAVVASGASNTSLDPSGVLAPLAGFALVWALSQAVSSLQGSVNEIMADRAQFVATTVCIEKASLFDLAFFDSGKLTGRLDLVRQQVWRLYNSTTMLIVVLTQLAAGVTLLSLLFSINPIIPVVLCLAVLPRVFVRSYFANRMYAYYTSKIESDELSWHIAWMLGNAQCAKDVRLFGLSAHLLDRYRALKHDHMQGTQKIIWQREQAMIPVGLLASLGTILSWGIATAQALAGAISPGGLAAVFQSVQQLGQTFDTLFDQLGFLYSNNPYIAEFFAFLDMPPTSIPGALMTPPTCGDSARVPNSISKGLRFERVFFTYPESDKPILDGISFELRPSESIAIVGENGAGKSTLSKLIARLYDPTSGEVTLDEVDLRCYDKHDYYRHVSAVFQDYPRIHLSARDNIGFGDVVRLTDETRIAQAAEMGGASKMIADLPHGLDTMLGKTLERGVELSGGQWQRIALARAFMRDAQVLILDEPSAALDPLAERDIYQRFAQLAAGKMTVLISHRLASCKMADRILVLEGGKIIEEGSHDALMAKGGRYAEMFTAQAEQYAVDPKGFRNP